MRNLEIHHTPIGSFPPGEPRSLAGQAAVETALILPALLVLLMGIIIAGLTFYAVIQVTNAAREGARAGSMYRLTVATRSPRFQASNTWSPWRSFFELSRPSTFASLSSDIFSRGSSAVASAPTDSPSGSSSTTGSTSGSNRGNRQAGAVVGLHYHLHQADYWYVPFGTARVVLHDLREGGPTDGATHCLDLSGDNHMGVFIPPGVAHGFAALTDMTITYLVDNYYNPAEVELKHDDKGQRIGAILRSGARAWVYVDARYAPPG